MESRPAGREVKKLGIRIEKPQIVPPSAPPAPIPPSAENGLNFFLIFMLFLSFLFSAGALYFVWRVS